MVTCSTSYSGEPFFRGSIPTPLELENAIAVVEDEVHIAHRQLQGLLPPGQVWAPWSADAALHDLATLAGVPRGPHRVLTLEAMERLFNRLAAVSEGRPAAQEGLPDDPAFAGTLLVLRELMHHLPFASLVLVVGTTGAGNRPEQAASCAGAALCRSAQLGKSCKT